MQDIAGLMLIPQPEQQAASPVRPVPLPKSFQPQEIFALPFPLAVVHNAVELVMSDSKEIKIFPQGIPRPFQHADSPSL